MLARITPYHLGSKICSTRKRKMFFAVCCCLNWWPTDWALLLHSRVYSESHTLNAEKYCDSPARGLSASHPRACQIFYHFLRRNEREKNYGSLPDSLSLSISPFLSLHSCEIRACAVMRHFNNCLDFEQRLLISHTRFAWQINKKKGSSKWSASGVSVWWYFDRARPNNITMNFSTNDKYLMIYTPFWANIKKYKEII